MIKERKASFPFWAWNGKMEKKIIKEQIKRVKNMSYGGFLIHARTGLETEYLGEEWFDCVSTAINEAEKQGLDVYLYDEDRYPSGTCGGKVTKNSEYAAKQLCLSVVDDFIIERYDNIVGVFTAKFEDCYIKEYKKYQGENIGKILVFYIKHSSASSYYNGSAYLDTLKREATEEFLSLTLDEYYKKFRDKFGTVIKGVFTDEVHYEHLFCEELLYNGEKPNVKVAYTDIVFTEFKKHYGYDLVEVLPELFFARKDNDYRKIAWQYIRLLQDLFLNNFASVYKERCSRYGIKFIGHILQEDTLSSQTVCCGSCMAFYEYFDYPGVDVLCESLDNQWILKQVQSVAEQLDKAYTLAECYGATGYNVSMDTYRKISDTMSVYGIDFKVPHLILYTMKGRCKRDYPCNFSIQTSKEEDINYLESRCINVDKYIHLGIREDCTLVISPLESVWALSRSYAFEDEIFSARASDIKEIEKNYASLFNALMKNHIEFDYGDEELMEKYSSVEVIKNIPYFIVGNKKYKRVVLFNNRVLRSNTFKLLKQFISLGGEVISDGKVQYVNFEKIENGSLSYIYAKTVANVCDKILFLQDIRIDTDENVISSFKKIKNGYLLFVIQADKNPVNKKINITISKEFNVYEIDLISDKKKGTDFNKENGKTIIKSSFESGQTRLFILTSEDAELTRKEECRYKRVNLPVEMEYEIKEENVLVLDYAICSKNGDYGTRKYVLDIDSEIRNDFCLEQKKEMMTQPYVLSKKEKYNKKLCSIELLYQFDIEYLPKKIFVAIEQIEEFRIKINNKKFIFDHTDFWTDKCFSKISIPTEYFNQGKNIISLSCDYKDYINIEPIYILGYFGVNINKNSIIRLPDKVTCNNLVEQGFPFYGGGIIYKTGISKGEISVKMQEVSAVSNIISFGSNRANVSFVPFESEFYDIDGELKIELFISRNNTFGAIHNKNIYSKWNGPFNYINRYDGNFTDKYTLCPSGLLNEPIIKRKIKQHH